MRPIAGGGDIFSGRSRKSSIADNQASTSLAGPGHGAPTTYFLTNNEPIAQSTGTLQQAHGGKESTYGVQSLDNTVSPVDGGDSEEAFEGKSAESSNMMERKGSKRKRSKSSTSGQHESSMNAGEASPSQRTHRRLSQTTISQPLTPLLLASPAPGSSMPSSPISTSTKSCRHSDEESVVDDAANQAVIFSEDEDGGVSSELMGSAPQLIMPSIKMPSRRPFTDRGKNMGRLKVLIAGDSSIGKTSLIKSIVQVCEDIVHVDPLTPAMPTLQTPQPRKSKSKGATPDTIATRKVTEVYASTRPYPSWWSDVDESKVLRRRKSMGDNVLERNLCFVDTPGNALGAPFAERFEPVIRYMESQLERTASAINMNDGDTLGLLSGNGGFHVDIIFYLISNSIKPVDIEFMRRLSPLCNVIPVIAKADLLSPDQIPSIKSSIMADLRDKSIQSFLFGRTPTNTLETTRLTPPFAVSSLTASDAEIMDASLLMSPDYVQPLIPSELASLVDQVFERENIAWLRHAAAKKFIQWRKAFASVPAAVQSLQSSLEVGRNPLTRLGDSTSSSNLDFHSTSSASQVLVSYAGGNPSYALARVADHTHREERLAQVRLAKWAGDLQRSLQNEKERYDALLKGERAIWLTEKLGECVIDGTLVPVTSPQRDMALARPISVQHRPGSESTMRLGAMNTRGSSLASLDPKDPLGLLRWNEGIRNKGWVAVQLLGSFGVIGALAVWFAKNRGFNSETLGTWNWNWWGGGV
ncbi:MAG: hypothetical protein M1812_000042 [Candelaria pacifica]|nr:MAG: hypothetical protein M1812_000042 [Candelaria pacifica]